MSKEKTGSTTSTRDMASEGFTAEERAAMKERVKEAKAESRRLTKEEKAEAAELAVLEKIAEMPDADRILAERVHEIVKTNAPGLAPKSWYGMPAYALEGKIVCFFQGADKFDARYATIGFNDSANLDSGAIWPTSFALKEMTPDAEKLITELVKKAVS